MCGAREFGDRRAGQHPPLAEKSDAVGNAPQRIEIVGDDQHRQPESGAQFEHQLVKSGGTERIEAGGRLVEQQQLGIERQRPRHRRPLDHAAGELVRQFVGGIGRQAGERDLQPCQLIDQPRRQRRVLLQRQGDVLAHAERGKQRPLLEHHAEAPAQRVELGGGGGAGIDAEQPHAAGLRAVEQRNDAQQRALAAAAAADQPDDLAAADLQRQILVHALRAEARGDAAERDRRRQIFSHENSTENAASTTITIKIACTTDTVVWRPTASAPPRTRRPW